MAVAKKKIQAKKTKTSPAAKKTAKPAAKAGPKGKRTAKVSRPSVKGVSRTVQVKPAAKKIAAKKKPAPKKTAAAPKMKKAVGQKKVATKKTPATKAAVRKTREVLTSALKKKPAARKPEKKVAVWKKPAASQKSTVSVSAAGDRLRALKGMLIERRTGILKEAKNEIAKYMSGDNRQLVDTAIDEGDWAVVDISEDLSLRRLDSHRQLLRDIDECLRKIQEGTYGFCEECGEEISQKRLNVIPTATLCIDCKENKEKMEALEQTTVI
jgi:DnaK suppressor protein